MSVLLWSILIASALLLAGVVLRARLDVLQRFFVPASVAGGLVGFVLVQMALRVPAPDGSTAPAIVDHVRALAENLRGWPSFLIAVVFAGLLLERGERRPATPGGAARGAAMAGVMVWIIVLGQVALGLLATWLVIRPAGYDVPAAFGQLIEAGFAGGHGTAGALGDIYATILDFADGRDLGFTMATIGIVYSVISGIVLVNIGVRRGWTRRGRVEIEPVSGLETRHAPTPMAFARVGADVIDPLAFQLVLVAMAFLLGAGLRELFIWLADLAIPAEARFDDVRRAVGNVPLFLFALIGGWGVRHGLQLMRLGDLLDDASIRRIVGVAMDFLIVAAIASLRIDVIGAYMGPLALLCGLGFVWTAVCLVVLSRRLLPAEHWFELGLINYGMSTGTTAQGFMLLRLVDKDLESGAAEDYALAAPLSAPFVGGGILTMSLPVILTQVSLPLAIGVLVAACVMLYGIGRTLHRARHGSDLPS